jgi:signal transduction histidine kinase
MNHLRPLLKRQITLIVIFALILVWTVAAYELYRNRQSQLHEAEVRTAVQAHVFAEYSRSTLKRINEFMLNIRTDWTGDWETFAALVQRRQENIDDLTFQVAIIDRDGFLAYSNLAKPNDRTDLNEREHFRVHKEANNADHLFVSRPLMGKVSKKWSIQMTRPIFKDGIFNGVLVISLSPEQFASFAEKLRIAGGSSLTVVRNSGEIMARYPAVESSLGKVVKGAVFLDAAAPDFGNYQRAATADGLERIFGYYRLPEYGMTFVLGEAMTDVLAPYVEHRSMVLLGASSVSVLALLLFLMLYRSLSSLEEVQRQLDSIFSLSPDGFVSFDKGHRVKYISPTFFRMTGLERLDLLGIDEIQFAERLAGLCVEQASFPDFEAMRSAQKQSVAKSNLGGNHRQLIELACAGKRVLEVGIRLSDTGSVSQILYFRDVTHETEVDRMKSEFVSTAAHELRTPMASIYGYSELLITQDFAEDERNDFLGIIHRQSELMISIINELLDLVRIEERRGKDFDQVRIEVGELLTEVIANFKVIEGYEAPLVTSIKNQHFLRGDRKKLTQAISNVLSNAYKYSPAHGTVEIDLLEEGSDAAAGKIGIRITDQGIGMTPEQLSRVFERFYRADTSGKIPGTGLGMSIVKEIIELHGGWVELVSKMGSGTAVTLWIPKV